MNEAKRAIWFPAKTYGWGWGLPVYWQGWVVMAVYMALLAAGVRWFFSRKPEFVGYAIALSLALLAVCWWKGETPAWRWGKRRSDVR